LYEKYTSKNNIRVLSNDNPNKFVRNVYMNTIGPLLFSVAFLVALNISCHVIYDN